MLLTHTLTHNEHIQETMESFMKFYSVLYWWAYLSQYWICYRVEIDSSFISQIVEYVQGSNSLRALLFVAKYQVNPLVELAGNKLTLQGLKQNTMRLIWFQERISWK